jgi:hypothetical protein
MKNNTMIPYNPKKDLETNYYNKTEVELLVAGGSGGSIDLSNYYKKLETYSKAQVDALVAGGGADLSDYYTKAEVDGLLDSISLDDYYTKTQTEVLLSNKVDKVTGKGLSTNDFTNTFKQAYDGHLASTSNPHNVTALQVGAYSKSENDNLLIKKANLDINNKIPLSEIPDSILGQLKYMGVWDFSSGFPTGAQKGNYWITSVSGNGYEVGDWAVYNGTSFDKVDNTDAVSSVAGRTGNVVLNKNDVGLNNVDNTSDLNKPISTATQTALDAKATTTALNTEKARIDAILTSASANADTFAEIVTLINSVDTTNDTAFSGYVTSNNARSTTIETTLGNKVDKVAGKQLSTEDYTTVEKSKLSGIATNANNYILPTASSSVNGGVKVSATTQTVTANAVSATAAKTYAVQLDASNNAVVNVPWSDTDTVYTHPTTDGNLHVPATSTTNNGKVLMAGSTAGSMSWSTLPSVTTSVAGYMSAVDKVKLDGIAAGANNYVKPVNEPISYITGLQTALDTKLNKNELPSSLNPIIISGQVGSQTSVSVGKIPFGEIWVNIGGISYNSATRRFTVPQAGTYRITMNPFKASSVATARVLIGINTDTPTPSAHRGHTYASGGVYSTMSINSVVNLSANDYIVFYLLEGELFNATIDMFNQFTIERIA